MRVLIKIPFVISFIIITLFINMHCSLFLMAQVKEKKPALMYNYEDKRSCQVLNRNAMIGGASVWDDYPLNLLGSMAAPQCVNVRYDGKLYIILRVGDSYEYGKGTGSGLEFEINCNVTVTKYNSGSACGSFTKSLGIKVKDGDVIPEDLAFENFTYECGGSNLVRFVITNISFVTENYYGTPPNAISNIRNDLQLELFYTLDKKVSAKHKDYPEQPIINVDYFQVNAKKYYYYLSSTGTLQNKLQPIRLKWSFLDGCRADSIPFYHIQILKLNNINDTYYSSYEIEATVDWNYALNLYTANSNQYLDVVLAEGSGFYLWRVRPIGNYYPGGIANESNWGEWNYVRSTSLNYHIPLQNTNGYYIHNDEHIFFFIRVDMDNENLNWIHERVITDEVHTGNKLLDKTSHFDDLLNFKQTQSKLTSNDVSIVSQSYLDHLGRSTIQSLGFASKDNIYNQSVAPLPASITGLNYKNNLMTYSGSSIGLNFYDSGLEQLIAVNGGVLDEYYNGDDNLGWTINVKYPIPDAEGFPYTRQVFSEDGSGRIRLAGGFGKELNNFTSTNNTVTKTSYSQPSDIELTSIFGDEAPNPYSVLKSCVTNPNQLTSISYIDISGKTIATAIRQNPSIIRDPLADDSEFNSAVSHQVVGFERIADSYSFRALKKFNVQEPYASVTVNYQIQRFQVGIDLCGNLADFYHQLGIKSEISINGMPGSSPFIKRTFIFPAGSGYPESDSYGPDISTFNGGDYSAQRILTFDIETIKDALKTHIETQFGAVIVPELQPVLNQLELISESEEPNLDNFYTWISTYPGWEYNAIKKEYWFSSQCCGIFTIPKYSCKSDCLLHITGDGDGQPTNFEAHLKDKWKSTIQYYYNAEGNLIGNEISDESNTLRSYFYRDSDNDGDSDFLYPAVGTFTKGNGAFDALVNHMYTDDGFPKEKLCDCWTTLVENYPDLAFMPDPNDQNNPPRKIPNPAFDLLQAFLDCTEAKLKGISNHEYGTSTASSPVLKNGTWPDYGDGYLEYAHKYFKYEPYNKRSVNCENISSVSFFESSPDRVILNPNSWPDDDETHENWQKFRQCIRTEISHAEFKDRAEDIKNKYGSNPKYPNFDLSNCYGEDGNLDYMCIEQIVKQKIDLCETNCDNRAFRARVIEFCHEQGKCVENIDYEFTKGGVTYVIDNWVGGYPYYGGSRITNILNSDIVFAYIVDEFAEILTAHCKSDCHLSIIPTLENGSSVIKIGTAKELASYNKAMTYDYEITNLYGISVFYPDSVGCSASWTSLSSDTFTDGRRIPTSKAYYVNLINHMNQALETRIGEITDALPYQSGMGAYEYATFRADNCNSIRTALNNFNSLTARDYGLDFDYCYSCSQSGSTLFHPSYFSCPEPDEGFPMEIPYFTLYLNTYYSSLGDLRPTYREVPVAHLVTSCSTGQLAEEWSIFPKYEWLSTRVCLNSNKYTYQYVDISQRFVDKFFIHENYSTYYLSLARHWEVDGNPTYYNAEYSSYPSENTFLRNNVVYIPGNAVMCFRWVEPPDIEDYESDIVLKLKLKDCESENLPLIVNSIRNQLEDCKEKILKDANLFIDNKIDEIVSNPGSFLHESFTIQYNLQQEHYTLYYYDRAGNLVRTIPPKGVEISTGYTRSTHPPHTYNSIYQHNSVGNLLVSKSPDENNEKKYYYDRFNRLRFSVDAAQGYAGLMSYIKYDNYNRIIESGECQNYLNEQQLFDIANTNDVYPDPAVLRTTYNEFVYSNPASALPDPYTSDIQENVRNRLSYAIRHNSITRTPPCAWNDVTTYYSYDPHGNVKWIIQKLPVLCDGVDVPRPEALPYFISAKIEYQYDLISGNLNKMLYNKGRVDEFYQRFEYDSDNRIVKAFSSRDNEIYDTDANYIYYPHGPVYKTEIGEDGLTVNDYVYTIQGALKAMNHSRLENRYGEGLNSKNVKTAPDQFGFVINYHQNDFKNYSDIVNLDPANRLDYYNQYDGNIASVEHSYSDDIRALPGFSTLQNGAKYKFDKIGRLRGAQNATSNGTVWSDITPASSHNSSFAYDGNGNFTSLINKNAAGDDRDNIIYPALTTNNKIPSVTGTTSISFTYDKVGNTIIENENGSRRDIGWTFDGKIAKVTKPNNISATPCCEPPVPFELTIRFLYDAQGNRVVKYIEAPALHTAKHNCASNCSECFEKYGLHGTYYMREANGDIIAIYTDTIKVNCPVVMAESKKPDLQAGCDCHPYSGLKLDEWHVYGSASDGRIAVVRPKPPKGTSTYNPATITHYPRRLGEKIYEIHDHLGNIRTSFLDIKEPRNLLLAKIDYSYKLHTLTAVNYFPYGSERDGQSYQAPEYNFGFNAMLRDDEVRGDGRSYSTLFREYDALLGRWMSVDPKSPKFADKSPYLFSSNNPIINVDKDGDDDGYIMSERFATGHRDFAEKNPKLKPFIAGACVIAPLLVLAPEIVLPALARTAQAIGPTVVAAYTQYKTLDPTGEKLGGTIAGIFDPNPGADYPGFGDDIVRSAKSIWNMKDHLARGLEIEKLLGGNLPRNFPVIDKFVNGIATSIKSLDHTQSIYQNASKLKSTLVGYIDKLKNFNYGRLSGKRIDENEIKGKFLEIALPPERLSKEQEKAVKEAIEYGKKNNITVDVKQIDASQK